MALHRGLPGVVEADDVGVLQPLQHLHLLAETLPLRLGQLPGLLPETQSLGRKLCKEDLGIFLDAKVKVNFTDPRPETTVNVSTTWMRRRNSAPFTALLLLLLEAPLCRSSEVAAGRQLIDSLSDSLIDSLSDSWIDSLIDSLISWFTQTQTGSGSN